MQIIQGVLSYKLDLTFSLDLLMQFAFVCDGSGRVVCCIDAGNYTRNY